MGQRMKTGSLVCGFLNANEDFCMLVLERPKRTVLFPLLQLPQTGTWGTLAAFHLI